MNLGIVTRPRLGIDFASPSSPGRRVATGAASCAASTMSDAEGRVQAAHLANKKHPRRVGPGA